jgi:hypothetical protein
MTKQATFTLSFDSEADGGPTFLLSLLKGFVLEFLNDDGPSLIAQVVDVDSDKDVVIVTKFFDSAEEYTEAELEEPKHIRLAIGFDFDHVVYC